jgi:outer membrane receptor for ferrienterochelin and colicin
MLSADAIQALKFIQSKDTIALILMLLCFSMRSFGQASISGQISAREQRLPSVTVLLLSIDSAIVKGVATDSIGKFRFEAVKPGEYLISASMVGYTKSFSQRFEVGAQSIVLPEMFLEEEATKLNEVIVRENRQLLEQKIDRLEINLEGSITSAGNTILEVLQKSPGVVVNRQNNTIAMNGKSGIRVMINNKMVQLPLDAVVQMLDGMNASNVDKIELITSPPSEYDAEGNAGIIHIITKTGEELGTNGSFGLMVGARWAENVGANFNVHHRTKRMSYFLDYSIVRNHNLHILESQRNYFETEFSQAVTSDSHRENLTTQQNLSAGFEWRLSKNTLLNVLFTGYNRNWDLNALTQDKNHADIDSTIVTEMNIHESNIWKSATGSIGLQTKIDSRNEVSVSLDYLYYHNSNPSTYDNSAYFEPAKTEQYKTELNKTTPIRFVIARTDYHYQLSPTLSLETGIKSVISALDNNVLVQRLVNDVWTLEPSFTSYSTLKERIYAGYVSTKWQIGKGLQINSGLRYEYTHTVLGSPDEANLVKRKYGYLFPSLSLKKKLASEKDMEFSYTRRITRPTYNDIAPYVFFWGPNTFSAGNTSLYPALSDAFTIGYHKKQWIISTQYTRVKNEITTLQPELDGENNFIYRSQNLKRLNTIGLTISYTVPVASWWELQSNLTAQYQTGKTSHLEHNMTIQLYGVNLNVINLLRLPKDFSIEISGMYQSKSLSGISEFLPIGSLNAGVQKSFRDKGTLRLAMDDILSTNNWRIKTNSPDNNLNSYFNYNWHNQFIRVTYTRSFGNTDLRSVKLKSGSEEERRRVIN